MKSISQTKLECLKMAVSLASSKQVNHAAVIPMAMEFYKWVDGDDNVDIGQLYSKYAKKQVDR